jgi:hypothetical protein
VTTAFCTTPSGQANATGVAEKSRFALGDGLVLPLREPELVEIE